MITRKSQYKQNTMKYSDYVKVCQYLYINCSVTDFHASMAKLDKFKIVVDNE